MRTRSSAIQARERALVLLAGSHRRSSAGLPALRASGVNAAGEGLATRVNHAGEGLATAVNPAGHALATGVTPAGEGLLDDLPLGLASTTSRLPTLPGNLLMRQALARAPHLMSADDFRHVLVVRTFELRHIFCHELATSYTVRIEEIDCCFRATFAFLYCTETCVQKLLERDG